MSKRVQKRSAAAGEWLSEAAAEVRVGFEEDRVGGLSRRQRRRVEEPSAAPGGKRSLAEEAGLRRALSRQAAPRAEAVAESMDLWAEDGDQTVAAQTKTRSRGSARPAPSKGLSYHPSAEAHQEALAEAQAVELRKREQDRREALRGLAHVPALEAAAADSESESEGEEEEKEEGLVVRRGPSRRKSSKLTRAQRNKIRDRNIAGFQAHRDKADKLILKSISSIPAILRDIDAEEGRRLAEQELRRVLKEEAGRTREMSYAEAGAVPLTDELGGSLRTLLPKGVLVKALEADMRLRGELATAGRRAMRKGDQPHGARNLRWVAKHKYV